MTRPWSRLAVCSCAAAVAVAGVPVAAAAGGHARATTTTKKAKKAKKPRRSVAVRTAASWGIPAALLAPQRSTTPTGAATGPAADTGATAPAGSTTDPTTPTSTDPTTPARRTAIGVRAEEFRLTFNGDGITAGSYLLQLQNYGEDPHDLVVERAGSIVAHLPTTAPKANGVPGITQQTVALPAGQYTLYCALGDHRSRGMQAPLTVGP